MGLLPAFPDVPNGCEIYFVESSVEAFCIILSLLQPESLSQSPAEGYEKLQQILLRKQLPGSMKCCPDIISWFFANYSREYAARRREKNLLCRATLGSYLL
jgi:hypothetical protein